MTAPPEPATAPDLLRAFSNALTAPARHHLVIDQQTIPLIIAGSTRRTPTELARIVSNGISYRHPANPWPLMCHRLRREAGALDNDEPEGDTT